MADDLSMTIGDAFDALDTGDANPDAGADDGDGGDDTAPHLETEGEGGDGDLDDLDDDPGSSGDGDEEGDGDELDGDGDAEDDDSDPDGTADPIEVSEDDVIRLPDGSELAVKESALRQADYTRKTQELADKRREVEEQAEQVQQQYQQLTSWVQERSQDPVKFAAEIAASTGDATLGVAKVIRHLADSGQLDESFAEAFGLKVNETIDERGPKADVDELKQEFEQERQQREQRERQQQVVQHYLSQWDEVKQAEGLRHTDLEAEKAEFREVIEYARQHRITDLRRAYAARAWEQRKAEPGQPRTGPDPAVRRKKRASSGVTRRSAAPSGPAELPKPKDTAEAADRAWEKVMAGGA